MDIMNVHNLFVMLIKSFSLMELVLNAQPIKERLEREYVNHVHYIPDLNRTPMNALKKHVQQTKYSMLMEPV